VLAFYTDGLIDVGHKSAGLRMERLGRALAVSGTQSSDEIAEDIMSTLTGVDQRIDDGALLVVKFATP
jgi:serine phosphatase RsbU (regulator of sigma subunit)